MTKNRSNKLGRPPIQKLTPLSSDEKRRKRKVGRAKVSAAILLHEGAPPEYVAKVLRNVGLKVKVDDVMLWYAVGCPLKSGMVQRLSRGLATYVTPKSQKCT